jgi:hypothetical protein
MLTANPTPNPNSLKITDDAGRPFIERGLLSFRSSAEAESHPLGSALFALGGVTDVLILPSFLTLTVEAGTDWDALWPEATRIIEQHLGQTHG